MEGSNNTSKHPRCFCFLLFVCVLVILGSAKAIPAEQSKQNPPKIASVNRKSSGPYCGLYCLYAVMKLSDRQVDFRELVKPEYIGSRRGSSLAELKKAAQDYGLHALPAGKVTSRVLRNCPHPVILHVKSESTSREYDHYELFMAI